MSGALMMMMVAAGVGFGVWTVGRALRPRATPLATTLRSVRQPGVSILEREPASNDRVTGIGQAASRILTTLGLGENEALAAQLRILDKPPERHAFEKLLAVIAGLSLPLVTGAALLAGGVGVNPAMGIIASAVLAAGGFFYPDLPLSEQVEKRQKAFRHALSSWLDLVTIILAGGGGIETALTGAAEAGDGWAFDEIRGALRRADLTGRTPWEVLDELGATLQINELSELAASVSLAGGQGAKIRQSLAAKADALRAQQAADIETNAEERTEKMIVPVTVMVIGLTLFIGFGAIDAISTDGGATYAPTTEAP
ncbi:MAG: type II secretion system F family protein [Actinomycetota bacterium]